MAGLWFDELTVGQRFDHAIRRTVTETDNLLFSTLTHNPAQLHLDAEYMKSSEYGRILVNSTFTLGLMVGVSVGDTTLGTAVADPNSTWTQNEAHWYKFTVDVADDNNAENKSTTAAFVWDAR